MNRYLKNIYRFFAAFVCICGMFCFTSVQETAGAPSQESLHIVTTIFPIYDWVRALLGERLQEVQLVNLLDTGVDLHSFQPTAADLMKMADADLFIYIGGESDAWVEDALRTTAGSDRVVVRLMDSIGERAALEELLPGMQASAEEAGESEEEAYYEHIWLSLKNAQYCVSAIGQALQDLDSDHAQDYTEMMEVYLQQLQDLDAAYANTVAGAARDTLLFADRFPFRYMMDDYGLTCYAAFEGCSAETEASFETVAFLAQTLKEKELPCVLTLEGSDEKLPSTIISASGLTDVSVLSMNSMQTLRSADAQEHTYLSVMESNLEVLGEALG